MYCIKKVFKRKINTNDEKATARSVMRPRKFIILWVINEDLRILIRQDLSEIQSKI